jgi:rubrerythrin
VNSLATTTSPVPKYHASQYPKIKPTQVTNMPAEIVNCPKCGISISDKQVCPFCDKSKKEGEKEEDETKDKQE